MKSWQLSVLLSLTVLWQCSFYLNRESFSSEYGRKDAAGFIHESGKHFIYFYYYLGLFPLTSTYTPLEYSAEGAQKLIDVHGDSLLMEKEYWSRLGENTRIMAYLPAAYLAGSPANPSIVPFNILTFLTALFLILIAFWLNGKTLLGILIVLFTGSSPFLLYETYNNENVFGLIIVTTLLILAINLRFFRRIKPSRMIWAFPIISGALIAFASDIRCEIVSVLGCCAFIYLTIPECTLKKRIFLMLLLFGSFIGVQRGLYLYYDKKFDETRQLVLKAGGVPYEGHRIRTHPIWHPLYCGLGDFDTTYGHVWDDHTAYRYALPILNEKYGMSLNYSGKYTLDDYYDPSGKYIKKIDLMPEYEKIIKTKFLSEVIHDPIWYIKILLKRVVYIFGETSEIWLAAGKFHIKIPFTGWLVIPLLLGLLYLKWWFEIKLLLFSLPLASTSFFIYAKGNTTFNSCFHLFLAALLCYWLILALRSLIDPKYSSLSRLNEEI